jgi:hypothetical protein
MTPPCRGVIPGPQHVFAFSWSSRCCTFRPVSLEERAFQTPTPSSKALQFNCVKERTKNYCILPPKENSTPFSLTSTTIQRPRLLRGRSKGASSITFCRQHTLLNNRYRHLLFFANKRYWTMMLRMLFLHLLPPHNSQSILLIVLEETRSL